MAASPDLRAIVGRMIEAGESEENIGAVIRRMTVPDPVSSQLETPELAMHPHARVASGAWNAVKGMAGFAAKASGVPGLFREGPIGAIKDQAEVIKNVFYDAPREQFEKARTAPSTAQSLLHEAAGLVPLAGPIAGHLTEEVAAGRAPEAFGEGAMMALLPEAGGVAGRAAGATARTAARSGRAVAKAARSVTPSGASAVVLGRAAKYAAKQVLPPILVEAGDMAFQAIKKNAAPVDPAPSVMVERLQNRVAALSDDPPPPVYETQAVAEPVVADVAAPVAAAPVAVAEPTAPVAAKPAKTSTAAEQLRDKIGAKELARVRKTLGTQDVKIARYEPRQDASGKFLGVSDPVYVMPDEFVEQAQMMGLRARGHTALEKSSRGKK